MTGERGDRSVSDTTGMANSVVRPYSMDGSGGDTERPLSHGGAESGGGTTGTISGGGPGHPPLPLLGFVRSRGAVSVRAAEPAQGVSRRAARRLRQRRADRADGGSDPQAASASEALASSVFTAVCQ